MRIFRPNRSAIAPALMALTIACGGGEAPSTDDRVPAPLVEAVAARSGALPIEQTVPGIVRARNQVMIRPEISGRIVEVMASSGETVRRGQPLVRLDATEAEERLRAAQADVRLAEASAVAAQARAAEVERRLGRTRTLAEQRLVSTQELEILEAESASARAEADEAAARVEQARATVDERRSELAKAVVRAPVSGTVGERRAEIGMLATPATVLFPVGDLTELIVEVHLTESMLAEVEVGQPVLLGGRAPAGEPVRAEVSRISPFLAEESFTTVAEIDVDNRDGRLRPGMFVSARILVGESRRATLVPIAALWEDPATGVRGVFVVEEAAGLETPAEGVPGAQTPTPEESRAVAFRRVEVLAEGAGAAGVDGLDEGAWVVTVGQQLLAAELRAAGRLTGAGAEGAATAPARIRPVAWERVAALQDLQNEDLLAGFLDKQRKVAAALGAAIPESEDAVDRVMAEAPAAGSELER